MAEEQNGTVAAEPEIQVGQVLMCGGTDFEVLGKSKKMTKAEAEQRLETYPNLRGPTRIKSVEGKTFTLVASGPVACHAILVDEAGDPYAMGRNDNGQLGLGDKAQRNVPTLIPTLKGKHIVSAACGRFHTVVVTKDGESYAFGTNKSGQCGLGKIRAADELTPQRVAVPECTHVVCGAEYTLWLGKDGKVYSAGNPQNGVLGHGTENKYNASNASIKLVYEPQPEPKAISVLSDVIRIAAGPNHAMAVTKQGHAYTWGCGGYGRLGHSQESRSQEDILRPTLLKDFTNRMALSDNAVIACSGTATFCSVKSGQLFSWGLTKPGGDAIMAPRALYELQGWAIRAMSAGNSHFGVLSEKSTITWGSGCTNGELGYGENGKKSSVNPDKVQALEGKKVHQIACGLAFTLFLVDAEEDISSFPEWEGAAEEEAAAPEPPAKGTKRKGAGDQGGTAKAARGRGRGRGRGK